MAEAIKWGVMGNATIARLCMIPAIQKSSNGSVHALATRSPAQAQQVAADHRIDQIYDSYDALLVDAAIDVVYIALPNHLHHPWAIKALKAGKHVLCEKPLACSAKEALELAAAAEDCGRYLMEAFMYRFHPRSRRIKQLVAEGRIGTPCLVRSAFCYRMSETDWANEKNARLKPEMGGGALLDVGCYSVSAARWLLGAEPTQVQAQAIYDRGGVDVHMVGSLGFGGTALATFEASFVSALQQTYTVVGRQGAIELPHNAFIPWEKDAVFVVRRHDQETGQECVITGADEYQLMVEHFADVVMGNSDLMVPPVDSIGNMRALDALAQAARTGETIRL
ncbi:MAG: Gfo/Idh/MocA family oxidoreductase [Deltaproteobacteria bacterium]|jgi:xylose dehydrogenase (NAD/NADP)